MLTTLSSKQIFTILQSYLSILGNKLNNPLVLKQEPFMILLSDSDKSLSTEWKTILQNKRRAIGSMVRIYKDKATISMHKMDILNLYSVYKQELTKALDTTLTDDPTNRSHSIFNKLINSNLTATDVIQYLKKNLSELEAPSTLFLLSLCFFKNDQIKVASFWYHYAVIRLHIDSKKLFITCDNPQSKDPNPIDPNSDYYIAEMTQNYVLTYFYTYITPHTYGKILPPNNYAEKLTTTLKEIPSLHPPFWLTMELPQHILGDKIGIMLEEDIKIIEDITTDIYTKKYIESYNASAPSSETNNSP